MASVVALMVEYQDATSLDNAVKLQRFMDRLVGALDGDLKTANEEAIKKAKDNIAASQTPLGNRSKKDLAGKHCMSDKFNNDEQSNFRRWKGRVMK